VDELTTTPGWCGVPLKPRMAKACAHSAHQRNWCILPWRLEMPFVTFTVRRDLSAADKSRLSEAMLEAQGPPAIPEPTAFTAFSRSTRMTFWWIPASPTTQRTGLIGSWSLR
jgi:hypothetical protein